jgi:hypothetical protein
VGDVAVAVLLTAAGGLALWRPWARPAPTPPAAAPEPAGGATFTPPVIDHTQVVSAMPAGPKLVVFVCVNESGGPCRVTVKGGHGSRNLSFELAAGPSRATTAVAGPYTVEAVTVERAGGSRRRELNQVVPAGERREFRVRADDEVVAVPAEP